MLHMNVTEYKKKWTFPFLNEKNISLFPTVIMDYSVKWFFVFCFQKNQLHQQQLKFQNTVSEQTLNVLVWAPNSVAQV